jgi:succinate-acetate transporter protein
MRQKFIKDLPIYLNGFAVGMLLWSIPNIGFVDIVCYILAMITFFWYGEQQKRNI